MAHRKQILYVHIGETTFVKKDIQILSSAYEVVVHEFQAKPKWGIPLSFVRQLIFLLTHGRRASVLMSQFAGYHSFLFGVWGKWKKLPLLIVASGTESANYPSIHYGNFAKPLYGRFTRWSFQMASHVAPVHRSLKESENHYYPEDRRKQGFLSHIPNRDIPTTEIPYGYDATRWPFLAKPRPRHFITVAHIGNQSRYVLKGVDLIVEVARQLPDCTFTVVGMNHDPGVPVPANVDFRASVPNDELPTLLNEHQFYLQLSISEGHPNALCEAMLCGCVPVVSQVTAMPEIVGDTGWILPRRDVDQLAALLQQARQEYRPAQSSAARQRIVERYPLDIRREKFLSLLENLTT